MKKNRALRAAIYRTPLPGGKLILLGALVMLIWAVWECAVRIDAMDGMTRAYFNLVKDGKLSLPDAFSNIWNTPKARQDWLNPAYLCLIALFSVIAVFLHNKWKTAFLFVPACVLILFYKPTDSLILSAFNLFEVIKFAAAGAVAVGNGMNVYAALHRRRMYIKRLKERERRRKLEACKHGRNPKTLIPQRLPSAKSARR